MEAGDGYMINILAERTIYYFHPALLIVLVCTIISMIIIVNLICFLEPKKLFIILLCVAVGVLFVILVCFIAKIGATPRTQYLIQITEETNFVQFNSLYEIRERISDTIFWCSLK